LYFDFIAMKVISTVSDIRRQIKNFRLSPVGLVPTMGALHEGHLSLIRNAIGESPLTVVSIYINPTQFNNKEDLKNYPRTLEMDLALLGKVLREDDLVFTPSDSEIYPVEDTRKFSFGNLDNVMEAVHRPGHFNGVAQVVSRLFEIIKPDAAYFGQKDLQQLAVIRELVRQTGSKVRIIGNPIIREPDGLAMSSRNKLLDPAIRMRAPVIFKTISEVSAMIKDHEVGEIKRFVTNAIEKKEGFSVEYFEIADIEKLIPVKSVKEMQRNTHYFGCIAVMAGKIRLIDNIEITLV
jgi:pantoate--beta-alanine ligase